MASSFSRSDSSPQGRLRRLRASPLLRSSLARVSLSPANLICPVFVVEGQGIEREVPSMPGVYQRSIDKTVEFLNRVEATGVSGYIAFGVIERSKKDAIGSPAVDPDNVVCRLVKAVRAAGIGLVAYTDLCMCEYTSHGHCGPMTADNVTVDNDATLPLLVRQAVNHAEAGADVIAPSGMMDHMIAHLRRGLDDAGFTNVALLSYAVKYASAFYGPFRDAADSAPTFGDRRTYQMDAQRGPSEAILEAQADVDEGADMVMVKPAGAFLDIIAAVRQQVHVPVAAYHVSGEYAMIEAAARNGWIDGPRVALESLYAIRRAGADLIISYYADRIAEILDAAAK